jgi:hypothetical protein
VEELNNNPHACIDDDGDERDVDACAGCDADDAVVGQLATEWVYYSSDSTTKQHDKHVDWKNTSLWWEHNKARCMN